MTMFESQGDTIRKLDLGGFYRLTSFLRYSIFCWKKMSG
jgi:hypothetical protein